MKKLLRASEILKIQARNRSVYAILSILVKALFKREKIIVYAVELDLDNNMSSSIATACEVKKGNIGDLKFIRKDIIQPYWEFSCNLYDGVKDYFICKYEGQVAHISWIYYKADPNRVIRLDADEAEVKYSLTLPQFRGKGIYPLILNNIKKYLKGKGVKRVFICTKDDNYSSVKGIQKAGFKFIKKISLVKILGIQLSRRYATNR